MESQFPIDSMEYAYQMWHRYNWNTFKMTIWARKTFYDVLMRNFHDSTLDAADKLTENAMPRYGVCRMVRRASEFDRCCVCLDEAQLYDAIDYRGRKVLLCSDNHAEDMWWIVRLIVALKLKDIEWVNDTFAMRQPSYDKWAQHRVLLWIWYGRKILGINRDVVLIIAKLIHCKGVQ
jgi:hypothetical protein